MSTTESQPSSVPALDSVDSPVATESGGDAVVRTTKLTKQFRSGQVAVDGIDLVVPRGAVYGFLGPNGSGKTTTIRMLLGLVTPTSGQAHVLGSAMPAGATRVLPRVGALVEGPAFQPYLSGRANLARLDAVDASANPRTSKARLNEALERVGLGAAAHKRYRQYSLGMKQRLGLAAALLSPRDLLILDEPTNGLDPQGTREVRHLIRDLAQDGATVLVSSHLLAEIEQVCTHIGVMSRGKLLVQGERDAITAHGDEQVRVVTRAEDAQRALEVLAGLAQLSGATPAPDQGEVTTEAGDAVVTGSIGKAELSEVAPALVSAGVQVLGLASVRPTLEDTFVKLTGEGFDVAR